MNDYILSLSEIPSDYLVSFSEIISEYLFYPLLKIMSDYILFISNFWNNEWIFIFTFLKSLMFLFSTFRKWSILWIMLSWMISLFLKDLYISTLE